MGKTVATAETTYDTWHTDPQREKAMGDAHAPYWRHFIATVPETDLSTRTVMDFGCNRGGFLRLLYALRPFRRGVGIDIAADSVQAAEANKGALPVAYEVATDLAPWTDTIDIAFSYEVVYLLADLAGHAARMRSVLRDGGVYYAVTGCHTANPIWSSLREAIGAGSNAPLQDRSPDDYVETFHDAGFSVSVKRFGYDGFVAAPRDPRYYPSILDAIRYPGEDKLLFRLEKRG
ncbi:MAG: class I SAM-dependent methyltransferase [Thalassobaculaceae bacterium]|nr:class I SAM-dependent methyltransferase [Thalassobaculaceae bacterium]